MAAIAAIRPLLQRTSALSSLSATAQKPPHQSLQAPSSQLHLPDTQPLRITTPLVPLLPFLSPSHHHHLHAAADAYTETNDDEDGEEPEAGDDHHQQQQPPSRTRSSATQEERRLYVGNLPFSMTDAQLTEVFSQAGTVDAVEIVYDRATDRSRGFAFVTMASAGEASEAIRMYNGAVSSNTLISVPSVTNPVNFLLLQQVGGRTVKVNFPEVPRGGEREVLGPRTRRNSRGFVESPYKVYAGNLNWTVTSQSLREAFAAQPGVLGARVVFDRDSGLSRGFGFVSFASPESVQSAIDAMNGKEMEGRPLRLSLAAGRPSTASSQSSEAEQLSAVES